MLNDPACQIPALNISLPINKQSEHLEGPIFNLMKLFGPIYILLIIFTVSCTARQFPPSDPEASRETVNLYYNLQKLTGRGYLVGHQDALAYGVHWKYKAGKSDIMEVTGDYPALYGWELGDLELGAALNLDSVPFDKMKAYIRQGYERGGVITLSWHANNPMTGKNAWDAAPGSVAAVLPGGVKHQTFVKQLDRVAAFLAGLKGAKGEAIPVLFRPFHELTGTWFWWGIKGCSPDEYKSLFRFTVDYLRKKKQLHNLLIVYNTANEFKSKDEFLLRYPGDEYADIISFDIYQHVKQGAGGSFISNLKFNLTVIDELAAERKKVAAIGELGFNQIPDPEWFTNSLYTTFRGHRLAYILLWRNAGYKSKEKEMEYYAPYKGHAAAADFFKFYRMPETIFEKEAASMQLYK